MKSLRFRDGLVLHLPSLVGLLSRCFASVASEFHINHALLLGRQIDQKMAVPEGNNGSTGGDLGVNTWAYPMSPLYPWFGEALTLCRVYDGPVPESVSTAGIPVVRIGTF